MSRKDYCGKNAKMFFDSLRFVVSQQEVRLFVCAVTSHLSVDKLIADEQSVTYPFVYSVLLKYT